MKLTMIVAGLMAATLPAMASAHAVLAVGEAAVGSHYTGTVRIGHGCEGQATLEVHVTMPEGFLSAKPMPKPGWALETVKAPYAKSYDYYGQTLTEGVHEIVWRGELPDEWYDEFTFSGKIDGSVAADSVLYFPVVQICATGRNDWVEIPAPGQNPHDLRGPAPGLKVVGGHHHDH